MRRSKSAASDPRFDRHVATRYWLVAFLSATSIALAACGGSLKSGSGHRSSAESGALPAFLAADGSTVLVSTLLQQPGYSLVEACTGDMATCRASGSWTAAKSTSNEGIFELSGVQPANALTISVRASKANDAAGSQIYQAFKFVTRSSPTLPNPSDSLITGGSCGSIKERIVSRQFPSGGTVKTGPENIYKGTANLERDWYNSAEALQIVTAVAPNGEVLVGWHDDSAVKIGRFSADLNSALGTPTSFSATRLRDIQVDQQGFAALALESSRMALRRFEGGTEKWRTQLIAKEQSKTLHMGRIARYDDGSYAAYFGVQGGGHQGDALLFVDASGQRSNRPGGWDWGCSHSMDQRLAIVAGKELPLCIGDNFPAAIALRRKTVVPEVKQYNGLGSGTLGGMVRFKDHMVVIESTKFDRQGRDIALVAFEATGSHKSKGRVWLTSTSGASEVKPKIAVYGSKLLVMWKEAGAAGEVFTVKVIDLTFSDSTFTVNVVKEETGVPFEIGFKDDLATTPQGHVVAGARVPGSAAQLQIQVIKNCNE